jgi:hypothetical protein
VVAFLRWVQRGALVLQPAAEGSVTEVLRMSERFADLPFDLADASIAEAAARLKLRHVLSLDAHFDVYRDRGDRALINLLGGWSPRREPTVRSTAASTKGAIA